MDKFQFFKDSRDKWRWRLVSINGRVVGASSQGYHWKGACIRNAKRHGYRGG